MNLDDDLRRALRRVPAPPGLADRVMGGVANGAPGAPIPVDAARISWRGWVAAAAVATLVLAGGTRYYLHQQLVAEAERVEADVARALQITSEKLDLVQRRVYDSQRDTR